MRGRGRHRGRCRGRAWHKQCHGWPPGGPSGGLAAGARWSCARSGTRQAPSLSRGRRSPRCGRGRAWCPSVCASSWSRRPSRTSAVTKTGFVTSFGTSGRRAAKCWSSPPVSRAQPSVLRCSVGPAREDPRPAPAGPGIVLEGDAGREQPTDYFGARVVSAYSFSCPLYWPLPLSFALR